MGCRSPDGEVPKEAAVPEFQEVFVGGLPGDVTEDDVAGIFGGVGEVLGVRLNRRRKTGESKGFAFVRFRDQLTAERACQEVKEVTLPTDIHPLIAWKIGLFLQPYATLRLNTRDDLSNLTMESPYGC